MKNVTPSTVTASHLPDGRVLLSQSDDNDAVRLTDAPLGPWGQSVVRLVENYAMDVLLVAEPT